MPEKSSNEENNLVTLLGPMGIYAQESKEQRKLLASDDLPVDTQGQGRAMFERVGIVFGDPVDELFVHVTLPEGWSRKGTSHSMWSYILDERGRQRILVFYKGAFYDRKAHMRMTRRFLVTSEMKVEDDWDGGRRHVVEDAAKPVDNPKKTGEVIFASDYAASNDYDAQDGHMKVCDAWLNEHFPLWEDPTAYWDEE